MRRLYLLYIVQHVAALQLLNKDSLWTAVLGHAQKCVGIKQKTVKNLATYHLMPCNSSSPSQQWSFNETSGSLYLTKFPEFCLTKAKNRVKAKLCGTKPALQKWEYDDSTGTLFLHGTTKCIRINDAKSPILRIGNNCRQKIMSWGDVREEPVTHVGIIGAGLAGISAAYELTKQLGGRVKIDIYEASDRVGGRTKTVQYKDMRFEDGGAYINSKHHHIRALAKELDSEVVYRGAPKTGIIRINGETHLGQEWIYPKYRKELECLSQVQDDQYETIWENYDYENSITIMDMLNKCNASDFLVKLSRIAMQGWWATELEDTGAISMADLWVIDTDKEVFHAWGNDGPGDEAYVFKKGTGEFVASLLSAALLHNVNIHFSTPITEVSAKISSKITVKNADMGLSAEFDKLVLAAPLPAFYDQGTIDVSGIAELSAAQQKYLKKFPMASAMKIHLVFDSEWWNEPSVNEMMKKANNESEIFLFLTDQFNVLWTNDSLLCCQHNNYHLDLYYAGSAVTRLLNGTFEQAVETALAEMTAAFPQSNVRGHFVEFVPGKVWERHHWSKGSFTAAPAAGDEEFYETMHATSVGKNVFLAGEHWSYDYSGYMEGAVASGIEAATNIAEQFQ